MNQLLLTILFLGTIIALSTTLSRWTVKAMNNKSRTYLQLIMTSLLLGTLSLPAGAAIKCWTNKDGVRECGDKVPPEYSQTGHQELSKQGLVKEEQQRARTDEELAAEAAKTAALAAEKLQKAEQAKQDTILLETFSSVEDIELVRKERLRAIDSSIKLAEKRTETIQLDLDKRIQSAADAERAGNAPNEALLKDIESLRRQINNNNEYIAEKRKEYEETSQEYAGNISRFKELKSL